MKIDYLGEEKRYSLGISQNKLPLELHNIHVHITSAHIYSLLKVHLAL